MKTIYNNLALTAVVLLSLTVTADSARAQTPSGLDIQLYPGLTITGAVDTVYAIEYTAELEESADWRVGGLLKLPTSPHLWFDRAAPIVEKRFYRAVEVDVEPATNMVFIQPGTFAIGSPSSEVDRESQEGPQTTVSISRGYWMGIYEVTQQEYVDVTGLPNPSAITGDVSRPVENLSWNEATNYCALLTTREQTAGNILANWSYRLPSEAEWEYACRADTATRFSHGDDPGYAELADYAWYIDSSDVGVGRMTHPVGLKLPNRWGLYDMHGSVFEWCMDWYVGSHPGGAVNDPMGPQTGIFRVSRGGSWSDAGRISRSARRGGSNPVDRSNRLGFRVVLAVVQP